MTFSEKLLAILIITMIAGCSGKHLINNEEYRNTVDAAFSQRKEVLKDRKEELFRVFDKKLSIQQKEALEFLISFSPLNDLAEFGSDFFLANINIALRSRAETTWGKILPEDIFLHYVLPLRVNNENLDSFRIICYDEILNRVRDKDIREAALEINHWCHEKVTYQPSDSRTSGPLSTILSARGRCGEESTFTVAALRTAGIPARQVYTPRWAHSDDNHAWVEIWCDGNWYYMGACEPDPVLDHGWFTEPARRAMLVNTKSFGAYSGIENVINLHEKFTEVNNLSKYAITRKIFIKILDIDNQPVNYAFVEYQLYNYAEFYPLAVVPTNENGISSFETGLGDLLIWARKENDFGFKKISVIDQDTIAIVLDRKPQGHLSFDLDLTVPVKRSPLPAISPELTVKNNQRLENENIIRQNYINSWMKPGEAKAFAIKINEDTSKIKDIIARSMGNYKTIVSFLKDTPDSLRTLAVELLEVISDKDLRDTKEEILSDHLLNCIKPVSINIKPENVSFTQFVLNPRIDNEMLVAWRSYFRKVLPADLTRQAIINPDLIAEYLNENIKIADEENYYKTPITPVGVNELKVSDTRSRSICFVAICRSLGIPSRLEPGSNVPQYFYGSGWKDVYFADQTRPSEKKGYLKFISSEKNPVPEYYIHFTIARFENGRYNTLEYEENKKITDFKEELQLTPGHYMMVTGNRLNDSKILSNITFFDLSENDHKTINVTLRKDISPPEVLGIIDLKKVLGTLADIRVPTAKIIENGLVILWVEPEKEPTKHIYNDLPLLKNELDTWGGYFLFLSRSSGSGIFKPEELKGLPSNSIFSDEDLTELLKTVMTQNSLSDINYPFIIYADKNGRILFKSEGYRIGIGEQILKAIR
jgi:hypothetical protein